MMEKERKTYTVKKLEDEKPKNIPDIGDMYETHNDRILNQEFKTPEDLVRRAVLSGRVSKDNERDLADFIKSIIEGDYFYHMTDYKIDESGTVSIPLTLRAIPGFIAQWEYEKQGGIDTRYPGIAEKLKPWIEGATDKTIEEIIVNKRVPDGVKKPKWIGKKKADAHRFKHWLDTTEGPMISWFDGLERFARDQTKGVVMELEGSIWDILKTIEK